jgi:hypothetical protein
MNRQASFLVCIRPCFPWPLQIDHSMAGMFLPFAGFGKQPVNAVTPRGGQLVFGAPDFAKDEVAFGRFNRIVLQCAWPFCSTNRRSRCWMATLAMCRQFHVSSISSSCTVASAMWAASPSAAAGRRPERMIAAAPVQRKKLWGNVSERTEEKGNQ